MKTDFINKKKRSWKVIKQSYVVTSLRLRNDLDGLASRQQNIDLTSNAKPL